MVVFHKHCVTKKIYEKIKHRILNKTQKKNKKWWKMVEKEPTKYLTIDELYSTSEKCNSNDIIRFANEFSKNNTKLHKGYRKRLQELEHLRKECIHHLGLDSIQRLQKKLIVHKKHTQVLLDIDIDYYLYKELGKQYENYRICHFCKHYDILNIDKLTKHFDYFDIKGFTYNPSKTCFSFCVDFIGNRNYHLFVKDIYANYIKHIPLHKKNESFVSIHQTLNRHHTTKQMSENYLWIDDETILYISNNKYYNSSKCYSYHIPSKTRRLVYSCNEHRELSLVDVQSTFYVLLLSSSYHSDKVYIIDIMDMTNHYRKKAYCLQTPVLEDKPFVCYPYIDHIHATWYILKDDSGVYTFMKTMDFQSYDILFTKKTKGLFIRDVYYMNEMFIFFSRIQSESYLFLFDICKRKCKQIETNMCAIKNSCHFEVMNFIPEQNKVYFYSSSFTQQNKLFILEIDKERNHQLELIPMELRGEPKRRSISYEEKVVFLKNKTIQITLIYKKGLKLQNCKCILYGYGAYGDHYDSIFNSSNILTLCDMGFLVIISQISGDRTLGFEQRKKGMLLKKKNTFHDFIYIIEHYLFAKKITTKDKLAIWGRSAGGLLIGAVLNMRPDICKVAILGVPFISPYLTMQSSHNPLAFESHSEWGNPLKQPNADYIHSYSPYQNIMNKGNYPNMFIYSNLNDTLVPYTEPYMYYQSLRKDVDVFRENKKELYLHIEDKFGHSQGTSIKDKYYQYALIFRFIQKHI